MLSIDVYSLSVSDLSVSDSVGYCRGSDFLMDVNYLHYLWDARQAISTAHRSVSNLCSWTIKSGDGLWINLVLLHIVCSISDAAGYVH